MKRYMLTAVLVVASMIVVMTQTALCIPVETIGPPPVPIVRPVMPHHDFRPPVLYFGPPPPSIFELPPVTVLPPPVAIPAELPPPPPPPPTVIKPSTVLTPVFGPMPLDPAIHPNAPALHPDGPFPAGPWSDMHMSPRPMPPVGKGVGHPHLKRHR